MDDDWTQDFFLKDPQFYLDSLQDALHAERTAKEVDGLVKALGLKPQSRILDLACGHGRHAIELARRGYTLVTGLDLTPAYLEMAVREAERAGVAVEWVQGDMRTLAFNCEFDAVYSMFTALFYFDDETNQGVLESISRALRPGGRFLVDTNNPIGVLRRFLPRQWDRLPGGGWRLKESNYNLRLGREENTWTIVYPDGREEMRRVRVRWYTAPELERMLTAAGLRLTDLHGDMSLSPYAMDAMRLVAVAEK